MMIPIMPRKKPTRNPVEPERPFESYIDPAMKAEMIPTMKHVINSAPDKIGSSDRDSESPQQHGLHSVPTTVHRVHGWDVGARLGT